MKISNFCLLFFFLFFLLNQLQAQSKEYVQGYMITEANDTINGFIKDDKRTVLAYQFSFKKTLNGRAKTITPTEAKGFYFTPSFYFESIPINSAQDKLEKQFIRKLVDGYTDLYQVVKGTQYEYVLIKEDGEKLQIAQNDVVEDNTYRTDKKYFGELKYFLRDCKEVVVNTKSIKYSEKSIVNLVQKYNYCKDPTMVSQSLDQGRKLRLKAGLTLGFRRYNMDISDLQPPNRLYEGSGAGLRFGGLIALSYFRKLSLQTGVVYNRYATEGQYVYTLGFGKLSHEVTNIDVPILLKYNFSTKKAAPYFIGGIHLGKLLKGTSTEVRTEVDTIILDEAYDLTLNNIVTYAAGFGVTLQIGKATALNLDLMYNRTIMHIRVLPDTTVSGMVISGSIFF